MIRIVWDKLAIVDDDSFCGYCIVSVRVIVSKDKQNLIQFLLRLSESYEKVQTKLLMMHPLPTFNFAYPVLEDNQLLVVESATEILIDKDLPQVGEHLTFYATPHLPLEFPWSYCGKYEHNEDRCLEKHSVPNNVNKMWYANDVYLGASFGSTGLCCCSVFDLALRW